MVARFRRRRFAWWVFQSGFLLLWVLLVLIGTFLRGPNWSFFGPYEPRDPHKVLSLSNVTLSEGFWAGLLGRGVPQPAREAGALARFGQIAWREMPGLAALGLYFGAAPVLLGRTLLKRLRRELGRARYWIMVLMLMMMAALPLKMLLAWTLRLSYVVNVPEYSFQF